MAEITSSRDRERAAAAAAAAELASGRGHAGASEKRCAELDAELARAVARANDLREEARAAAASAEARMTEERAAGAARAALVGSLQARLSELQRKYDALVAMPVSARAACATPDLI